MRLAQKLKTKTLLTLMRGVAGAERLIKGHQLICSTLRFSKIPMTPGKNCARHPLFITQWHSRDIGQPTSTCPRSPAGQTIWF